MNGGIIFLAVLDVVLLVLLSYVWLTLAARLLRIEKQTSRLRHRVVNLAMSVTAIRLSLKLPDDDRLTLTDTELSDGA